MVNKNKAAAKVVTADSTLRMMIEDQKCYRYNLFFYISIKIFRFFWSFSFCIKLFSCLNRELFFCSRYFETFFPFF